MIGVILKPSEAEAAEEFFQLFKTPWEFHREGRAYDVVVTTGERPGGIAAKLVVVYSSTVLAGDARAHATTASQYQPVVLDYSGALMPIYGAVLSFADVDPGSRVLADGSRTVGFRVDATASRTLRLGYDLFREVQLLLSAGQPAELAHVPTLEHHIRLLREAILAAGIGLVEIPPVPAGHVFQACLTHDIDFAGIRAHKFDHSMWGFLYRSTLGGLRDYVKRRISIERLMRMWRAAASLPFVYAGLARDFWLPFEWYLRAEKQLPTTYFLIPFKHRAGERLSARHSERRATKYDISDIPQWTAKLLAAGCEIGVHGIDSWHSASKGREEMGRVAEVTHAPDIGVRMHWLLHDETTYRALDEAGYAYDSTAGYNETVGYRCGTMQVFRPHGTNRLLELPLHIQDGALFYPQQLGLTDAEAWRVCEAMIQRAQELGGVLTVLWHDRSHGPERFWGEFYLRLIERLRASKAWFGNAGQVVQWFRKRRQVCFVETCAADGSIQIELSYQGERIDPPLTVRIYQPAMPAERPGQPAKATDLSWTGAASIVLSQVSGKFAIPVPMPLNV